MNVRCTPHLSAKASWEYPCSVRNSLIRSPRAFRSRFESRSSTSTSVWDLACIRLQRLHRHRLHSMLESTECRFLRESERRPAVKSPKALSGGGGGGGGGGGKPQVRR